MAGRLDVKGRFDPEEDSGISRGYKHHSKPYLFEDLKVVTISTVTLKPAYVVISIYKIAAQNVASTGDLHKSK